MGETIAVTQSRTALDELDDKGAFKRRDSVYRDCIAPGTKFSPESNRYHLYVSLACPWASRCVATLYLKGLDHVIGLSVTHPTWGRTRPGDPEDLHAGWQFKSESDPPVANPAGYGEFCCDGCVPDSVNGATFVRDLYELAGDTNGKYTVPVLWDKKNRTIVNNESSDIVRILNSAFNDMAKNPQLDLYPEEKREEIDAMNERVYHAINNGVYKCGFATSQEAYDAAVGSLFEALDEVEKVLQKKRFLCGDEMTEADIRLFVTLIRFDIVYIVYFKTDKKAIREYPALKEYVKDLFSVPEIQKSVNINHIKTHYFTSHPILNAYAIIPRGPDPWWTEEHNRYKMTKQPVAWSV